MHCHHSNHANFFSLFVESLGANLYLHMVIIEDIEKDRSKHNNILLYSCDQNGYKQEFLCLFYVGKNCFEVHCFLSILQQLLMLKEYCKLFDLNLHLILFEFCNFLN